MILGVKSMLTPFRLLSSDLNLWDSKIDTLYVFLPDLWNYFGHSELKVFTCRTSYYPEICQELVRCFHLELFVHVQRLFSKCKAVVRKEGLVVRFCN